MVWEKAKILYGYMNRQSLEATLEESKPELSQEQVDKLLAEHAIARQFVQRLPAENLENIGIGPLPPRFKFREDEIRKTPEFIASYGEKSTGFALIKPQRLCAFQFVIRIGGRPLSTDPLQVLNDCLPKTFQNTADLLLFRDQSGQVFRVTATNDDSPVWVQDVRLDHARKSAELSFAPNHNWIQVAHFERKFWIHNGYHRVLNMIKAGVTEIPCVTYEASEPLEVSGPVFLPTLEGLRKLKRPPLMKDFFSTAATEVPIRRYRNVTSATVQVEQQRFPA